MIDKLEASWSPEVIALGGVWSESPPQLTFEQQLAAIVDEARREREARYAANIPDLRVDVR